MTESCAREHEVVAAVLGRRWSTASDELQRHADDCEICAEVVAVAELLVSDREQTRGDIRVPAAGQIWWRSAVRARLEAAQAAARPLTWVHGIAGACAIGLAIALMGVAWPLVQEWAAWFASQTFGADSGVGDAAALVSAVIQKSLPLAFVVAACLLLAPVALYFVLSDE